MDKLNEIKAQFESLNIQVEDIENKLGKTAAFLFSAGLNKVDYLKRTLELRFDVNEMYNGIPALFMAVCSGQIEGVQLLLEHKADVSIKCDGSDVLILASDGGLAATIELLLDRGADVESKNKFGHTALMIAAAREHFDCVELLMQRGAIIDKGTKELCPDLAQKYKYQRLKLEMLEAFEERLYSPPDGIGYQLLTIKHQLQEDIKQ